jgi:hypothetical protein
VAKDLKCNYACLMNANNLAKHVIKTKGVTSPPPQILPQPQRMSTQDSRADRTKVESTNCGGTLVGVKEFGIFRLEKFFLFLTSFFFGVITQLNFIEFYYPTSSDSVLLVKDLDWMFKISEIRLD